MGNTVREEWQGDANNRQHAGDHGNVDACCKHDRGSEPHAGQLIELLVVLEGNGSESDE